MAGCWQPVGGNLSARLHWLGESGPKLLGLAAFIVALWAQSDALVGIFFDDGIYVVGAKALAEGQGYRNLHLPGAPPMVHYPILYPLFLSLWWRLWPQFPGNTVLLELTDSAAFGTALWIMGRHARRLPLPFWASLGLLALGVIAFPLLTTLGVRFSEPLFLALAGAAISLADRHPGGLGTAASAGVLAGLATLCRSVGITVLAGVPVALWWTRRRKEAVVAAAAGVVLVVPWVLWTSRHYAEIDPLLANYTSYVQEAIQAGGKPILEGLALRAFWPIPELMFPRLPRWAFYPAALVLLGTLVSGAVRAAPRAPALVAVLGFYYAVASLWPFPPHRFVWVTVPWMLLLGGIGCAVVWTRGRAGQLAVAALGLLAVAGYLRREALSLSERRFAAPAERSSQAFRLLVGSIAAETPPDAVVASEDEALIYLYTGRHTVPSHLFRWEGLSTRPLPPEQIADYLCRSGTTHLAVTGPGDPAADLVLWLRGSARATAQPMFEVTGGPALYRLQCGR